MTKNLRKRLKYFYLYGGSLKRIRATKGIPNRIAAVVWKQTWQQDILTFNGTKYGGKVSRVSSITELPKYSS